MKKLVVLLLVCVLVFSITLTLTSCWWKNQPQEDPTPETPNTETPANPLDGNGGTSGVGIELPPANANGQPSSADVSGTGE